MDIERFSNLVQNTKYAKKDLLAFLHNAQAKNEKEFVATVKGQLDLRFPAWDEASSRRGGRTPTDVIFRSEKRHFDSAKKAYIWLIERFITAHPELFDYVNWETAFVAKGRSRLYFARDVGMMFPQSPHLAADNNNYTRLSNGWFANMNLANREKQQLLLKFAAVAKFPETEWWWHVEGTPEPDLDLGI